MNKYFKVYVGWVSAKKYYDYLQVREPAEILIELSRYSKKYTLCDEASEADIVIMVCERFDHDLSNLLENDIINCYLNKVILFSNNDCPPQKIFRGIYVSGKKAFYNLNRHKTTSYTAFSRKISNPYLNESDSVSFLQHRKYLMSFMGANTHKVRMKIFQLAFRRRDVYIENTSDKIDVFTGRFSDSKQNEYVQILKKSKFVICPRGNGTSSIRLFEAMRLGVSPIIISDKWILPNGPRWHEFSIFVKESEIEYLEEIVEKYEAKYYEMGILARDAYLNYFDDIVYFDRLVDECKSILDNEVIPEALIFMITKKTFRFKYYLKKLVYNIWDRKL